MHEARTFPRSEHAHDLVTWLLGISGAKSDAPHPPADAVPYLVAIPALNDAVGWAGHAPWAREAWRSRDPIAQAAVVIDRATGNLEGDQRALARREIEALAGLAEPAGKKAIADALKRLCDVLDQSLNPAAARFIIEMVEESQMPAAAVWTAMEHAARTEGGRIRPVTFQAMVASAEGRRPGLLRTVQPASIARSFFPQAWELLEGRGVPAYLSDLAEGLVSGSSGLGVPAHADEPDHELWRFVRGRITPTDFRLWLAKTRVSRDGEAIIVVAPSPFFRETISRDYGAMLREALGAPVEVVAA
jgi:hypothetical protein